jgi:VWFA-related protein
MVKVEGPVSLPCVRWRIVMILDRSSAIALLMLVSFSGAALAQGPQSAPLGAGQTIHLNVVVQTKSGTLVPDLSQQDFTVLDNKAARPIESFAVETPAQSPVHVIIFMDAVNTSFNEVAYERDGVDKFLRAREGQLADPTAIAILEDKGPEMADSYSTNGNAVADSLDHYAIALREVSRASSWGASERLQISMTAFHQLLNYAATMSGRKIVLWISPGWPLLSGPRIDLDWKQQQEIFNDIVSISTQMRKADVTLYNINPLGVGEPMLRADYFQEFLKGVSKPQQAQTGDVGLQVLAVQSGGLALESSSDVTGMLVRCMADVHSWYAISFESSSSREPNQYHHFEIRVGEKGLVARTRDGYYANPQAITPR